MHQWHPIWMIRGGQHREALRFPSLHCSLCYIINSVLLFTLLYLYLTNLFLERVMFVMPYMSSIPCDIIR